MSEKIYNPNKRAFKDVSNFQVFEKQMEKEAEKFFDEYATCIEKKIDSYKLADIGGEAFNREVLLSKNYAYLYRFYALLQCVFERTMSDRHKANDTLLSSPIFSVFSIYLEHADNLVHKLFNCTSNKQQKAECSFNIKKYSYMQKIYALGYQSSFMYHSQAREELAREYIRNSNFLFEYEWAQKDPKIGSNAHKISLELLAKYSDIENLGFDECGLSKRLEYPSYDQIFPKKTSNDFPQESSKEKQTVFALCGMQKALLAYFKIFTVCMLFLGKNNKKLLILEIYLRKII